MSNLKRYHQILESNCQLIYLFAFRARESILEVIIHLMLPEVLGSLEEWHVRTFSQSLNPSVGHLSAHQLVSQSLDELIHQIPQDS